MEVIGYVVAGQVALAAVLFGSVILDSVRGHFADKALLA
jgi:hypothetical protein